MDIVYNFTINLNTFGMHKVTAKKESQAIRKVLFRLSKQGIVHRKNCLSIANKVFEEGTFKVIDKVPDYQGMMGIRAYRLWKGIYD